MANDFFTCDSNRTFCLLKWVEAGMIGMNTGTASSAELVFGGIKESGYGKEAGKDAAINEHLILKTDMLKKLVCEI
ncbi:hypothetical protein E4T49_08557 [Aureobasidium sp. EXF-10728]|nr:hypothetical protein E4T49_08557 [Aureobasidium sp. EXF-10728]